MLQDAAGLLVFGGPAAAVTALETACTALGLDATGTLVAAHLSPAGDGLVGACAVDTRDRSLASW